MCSLKLLFTTMPYYLQSYQKLLSVVSAFLVCRNICKHLLPKHINYVTPHAIIYYLNLFFIFFFYGHSCLCFSLSFWGWNIYLFILVKNVLLTTCIVCYKYSQHLVLVCSHTSLYLWSVFIFFTWGRPVEAEAQLQSRLSPTRGRVCLLLPPLAYSCGELKFA